MYVTCMWHNTDISEYSINGAEKPKPLFKQCTYLQEPQASSNLSHYLL